jgi:hypothetical protein
MSNYNLLDNYILHCINDLKYPIQQLTKQEKILYLLNIDRELSVDTISILLNKPHKEIRKNIKIIKKKIYN